MASVSRSSVVVFGGDSSVQYSAERRFKDLLVYVRNAEEPPVGRWAVINLDGDVSGRSNHAAVLTKSNQLLLWGGWTVEGDLCTSDVVQIDLAALDVSPHHIHSSSPLRAPCTLLKCLGTPPSPRGQPSMVYDGASGVYVFGGWNGKTHFNDVHLLDLQTNTWSKVACSGSAPPPLADHTAVYDGVRESMIVFGGTSAKGRTNAVFALDLASYTWSSIDTLGSPPCPRSSHTSVLCSDHLYVFGGWAEGIGNLNDVHVLNLSTHHWRPLCCCGDPPPPVCRASAAVFESPLGAREMVVFFGYDAAGAPRGDVWALQLDRHDCSHSRSTTNVAPWPAARRDPDDIEEGGGAAWKVIRERHEAACRRGEDTYLDPATGYTVFTKLALARRPCCGNACRHCPWGHVNVIKTRKHRLNALSIANLPSTPS